MVNGELGRGNAAATVEWSMVNRQWSMVNEKMGGTRPGTGSVEWDLNKNEK
jgi:hypothetical protein